MTCSELVKPVVLGHVHGLFGVKGQIKVYSYTRPIEAILEYACWWLGQGEQWQPYQLLNGRFQGKTLVAQLAMRHEQPIVGRDEAAALLGLDIAVERSDMPDPPPGQHYWFDLVGLYVQTRQGVALGRVSGMMETGANDVLVVAGDRERLIPFVMGEFVQAIDWPSNTMTVDWDPDF